MHQAATDIIIMYNSKIRMMMQKCTLNGRRNKARILPESLTKFRGPELIIV